MTGYPCRSTLLSFGPHPVRHGRRPRPVAIIFRRDPFCGAARNMRSSDEFGRQEHPMVKSRMDEFVEDTSEAMEDALERIASEATELSGKARKVLARSSRQATEFAHDAADRARDRSRQA